MNEKNCDCQDCRKHYGVDVEPVEMGGNEKYGADVIDEKSEEDIFKIEVLDWTDYEDGSASVTLEMSKNTVQFFAQQGLLHTLVGASNAVIESSNS